MKQRRSRVNALAIAAAALLLALAAGPRVLASVPKTTMQAVSEGLTCQCGCGLTVANCNHPQCGFSVPLRTRIEAMIGRGMPRAQIIASFRGQYGEKILSAPTTEGFNLIAWIMPFAALLVGGGLIFMVLGRWRKRAPAFTLTTAANDAAYDPELRRQLERDLKEKI